MNDYIEKELRYAASIVLPRTDCQSYFENNYLKDRIGNTIICTDGDKGDYDSRGRHSVHTKPSRDMCDYTRRSGDLVSASPRYRWLR